MYKFSLILLALVFSCGGVNSASAAPAERSPLSKEINIWVSTACEQERSVGEVHVGENAVLKFYGASNNDEKSYQRAIKVSSAIGEILKRDKSFSGLMLDVENQQVVGIVDKKVIFAIEKEDEAGNETPAIELGLNWVNNLRGMFGGAKLPAVYKDYLIYRLKMKGNRIEVFKTKDGMSSLIINHKPTVSFLSYERACLISARLQDKILQGITPAVIAPGVTKGDLHYVRWGPDSIFAISPEDEKAHKLPGWKLAMQAVNDFRVAFGEIKFQAENIESIYTQTGIASWYGHYFQGRRTSNGESYDMYGFTAAHKKLPFGAEVLVTNLRNGKQLVVRINDRGPYIEGRIIDLTKTVANILGISGIAKVRIDVINLPAPKDKDDHRA